MVAADADFFKRLERQQAPEYLWIGCSDSRVPANEIVDLLRGELFVHRNVANLAPPQDANYLSVLQFAVDVLKVKHIIVVGHYGCGGVSAAVDGRRRGLVDYWLHPIREVFHENRRELDAIAERRARLDRLCELNVIRQVKNVASDVLVREAWARDQELRVHGWVHSGNVTRRALSEIYLGWAQAMTGDIDGGIARMRQHMLELKAVGSAIQEDYHLALIATALGRTGRFDEGLRTIAESFPIIERSGMRFYQAEVHRLKGELLLAQDVSNAAQAEQSFRTAIEIARKQKAKSWELRATMNLARLLAEQGHRDEAPAMLADIYNWFTEGFDTADLNDAKALLDKLNG